MHILFRFLAFVGMVAGILFLLGVLGWLWVKVEPLYSVVNSMTAMVQNRTYYLAPGSNVTIYPTGTITIQNNAYRDKMAHITILPSICVTLMGSNITQAETVCAQSGPRQILLEPGKYYVEVSNYVPLHQQVNSWLIALTPFIAVIIGLVLVLYLIHTRER